MQADCLGPLYGLGSFVRSSITLYAYVVYPDKSQILRFVRVCKRILDYSSCRLIVTAVLWGNIGRVWPL